MSQSQRPGDFFDQLSELTRRVDAIERWMRALNVPTYTLATLPDPTLSTAQIVFVRDAPAGSQYRGSDGAAWIPMG